MPRHINSQVENFLLNPASVAYSNPQSPLTPIVDPTVNNVTANITYFLNNNAAATAGLPLLSTRRNRFALLLTSALGN